MVEKFDKIGWVW